MFFTKLYIVAITLVALFFFTPAYAQVPTGWEIIQQTPGMDASITFSTDAAREGSYGMEIHVDGDYGDSVTFKLNGLDLDWSNDLQVDSRMEGSGLNPLLTTRYGLWYGDTVIYSYTGGHADFWATADLSPGAWDPGVLSRIDGFSMTVGYYPGFGTGPKTLWMDKFNINIGGWQIFYTAGDVGIIQGSVFNDTSGNSAREMGEEAMPDMMVYLTGTQTDSVMTDSLGNYKFSDLPHGSYTVTSPALPGFTQTMPMSGSYNVTIGPDTLLYIGDFGNYATSAMAFPVEKGWNLMSLPLDVPDASVTTLYPTAITAIFGFNGSYYEVDTMVRGYAVWGKFPSAQNVWLNGDSVSADTVEVLPGWNAIGGLTEPVLVSEITTSSAELTTGYFWEWRNNGYRVADTLVAGRGYWVRVSIAGSLMLQANTPDGVTIFSLRVAPDGEMPPTPPGGDEAVDIPTVAPSEFQLAQNYPNPFNPTTRISYDVPRAGNVRLVIYSLMGQEVATLVNEVREPGNYEVEFDASKLPSGVYIYKLQAGSFTATNKMILLK